MASINVLLLSADAEYSKRFGQYMGKYHTDIRLTILDSTANFSQILSVNSFNVILWDGEQVSPTVSLPPRAAFAYLSPSDALNNIDGKSVFCKYRSGETMYRIILDLFSTVSSNRSFDGMAGKVFAFMGAGGGVGASTMAAAFSKRCAASGMKTLYISLDKLFDSSLLFSGDSIGTLSDLISAVILLERGSSVNLSAKAQSLFCCEGTELYYIKSAGNPYEFNDLNKERRLETVYNALAGSLPFDVIVLDVPLHYELGWELALEKSGKIILVTEKRIAEESKMASALKMLKAYESHFEGVISKLSVIINRNAGNTPLPQDIDGVPVLGFAPKYNDNNAQSIVNAVARLDMWDRLS